MFFFKKHGLNFFWGLFKPDPRSFIEGGGKRLHLEVSAPVVNGCFIPPFGLPDVLPVGAVIEGEVEFFAPTSFLFEDDDDVACATLTKLESLVEEESVVVLIEGFHTFNTHHGGEGVEFGGGEGHFFAATGAKHCNCGKDC